MTQNFFALCHGPDGMEIKRIRVNNTVQNELVSLFNSQESAFRNGVTDEVSFFGDWKPDDHELLTIPDFPERQALYDAVGSNLTSLPELNLTDFADEPIKAVFTAVQTGDGHPKILMQRFTARQILSRRFTLMMDNNTFKKLEQPAFSMENFLVCIIEGGVLKFKDFGHVKPIFSLLQYYQEATNEDIDAFFADTSPIEIDNIDDFKTSADQIVRKRIRSIMDRNVFRDFDAAQIQSLAVNQGIDLALQNGKIQLPSTKKEAKVVLSFLDEKVYKGVFSGNTIISNSSRLLAA